ncbi:MAG: AI-2E family transporter [Frankiales bacterium]|nr:AI-2E family transporter [Frankiales bacterium]
MDEAVEVAAAQAEASAERAERAETGAFSAYQGAVEAGRGAVEAAAAILPPDDPILDTAVRKIEARVDEDNPYGRPGQPMSTRSPFRLAFTAALGVALAYGLVKALIAVQSVLVLLLTAAFLAIGLTPLVDKLERRKVKRVRAVGIVLAGVLLFFTGFGFAVVPPIVEQSASLIEQAPTYVQQLQDNRRIAELDNRFGLLNRAQEYVSDPARFGTAAAGGVLEVGKVVLTLLFNTILLLVLTLYFLSSLPTIKANAYRLIPRSRRARVGLLSDEILSRVGGYVAGAVTIAGIASVLTFTLLVALGVDYPLALAMLVFLTGLIPLIGATIGAVIITMVALFTSVKVGIIVAVYYVIYQQIENYVLYPRIMKRSVDVSPAATVVAVLIGGSLLGVLGALLAIPIAAAVQLVLKEVIAPRQDQR